MANTVIAIKKSATPTAQPTVLANGELAINYADGKLFYKHANGTILPFNTQGGNAFGTINANGTLVVAGSSEAVVTLVAGNNISIVGDAINDTITIESTAVANIAPAYDKANDAYLIANTAYNKANTGNIIASLAYDKANSANVLAYNTGIGTNTYLLSTIAGANTAVGTGANTISIAAFNKANNALANSTGTFSGNLTITGAFSIAGNNVSPVQSFRNKIINGNFDYWQRGTSNTSIASGQYLADRWRTNLTGSTANVSRQAFTLGQTSVPNEPTYFHRTVVTSSAGAGNLCVLIHPIESVRTLAGQTATLSFWAKADASKNIAIEFTQEFGSGGSPSSAIQSIGVTTCALTSSWQKFTIPVNIPSISGKTLGTDNNGWFGMVFWFDAGSSFNSRTNSLGQQSGTFDIAQVQLEAGSVATPFEMRPLGTELALCQRYYNDNLIQRVGGGATPPQTNRAWFGAVNFPVSMRAQPTLTKKVETLTNMNAGSFGDITAYYTIYSATNSVTNDADAKVTFSASAEL